jgi:hypothetical protein
LQHQFRCMPLYNSPRLARLREDRLGQPEQPSYATA